MSRQREDGAADACEPQRAREPQHDAGLADPASILEHLHEAIVTTDMQGIVQTWNPAAERLYGYSREEALGRHVGFLRFPDDRLTWQGDVVDALVKDGTFEIKRRNRRKDGSEIHIALRMSVQRNAAGEPVAMIGSAHDITDRERTSQSLRRQREEQQIILDAMPALVWYKDRDNNIVRVNRAAAESIGRTADELAGMSTYALYPDEAAKYHRDDLEVIESGQPKLGIVEMMRTASGEKRWVRTDKIPYRDERGEIVGVLVFAVDITDHKRAEEALERVRDELEERVAARTADLSDAVQRLRQEIAERRQVEEQMRRQQAELAHVLRLQTIEGVAAELAHEINQPLGAIANFANGLSARLRQGSGGREEMLEASEQIARQALRAGRVLQRLRDFTRKESPRRRLCDANTLVRDAAEFVESDLRRHGIAFRLQLADGLAPVQVDAVQVQQVILNLARNGIESMVEGGGAGELSIETAVTPGGTRITVRDSGPGIAQAARQKLFDPFFTTKDGGLGMGLSISRSIIEAHGGRLEALDSGPPGAAFSLTLPPAAAEGAE